MNAAPYPNDTRAKGWRFELDVERVRQSDTWALASPELRPWLLMLWMVAWEQTPCGSMPNDDELIAARIGMAPKLWTKARGVLLRGWIEHDDGRLYHSTITALVLSMVAAKQRDKTRKAEYRARMDAERARQSQSRPNLSHGTDVGRTEDSASRDDTGTGTGTSERGDTPLRPPARKRAPAAKPTVWMPPSWVPPDAWAEFEDHRKAMRGVPFTDAARNGVVRDLGALVEKGHLAADLLRTAITRGWRTVFEPKPTGADAVAPIARTGTHAGFVTKNYRQGISADGTLV